MIPGIIIYTFLSLLVAFFGRNRKFGFWIYLALCFVFTPLLAFVIILGSDKRRVPAPAPEAPANLAASPAAQS